MSVSGDESEESNCNDVVNDDVDVEEEMDEKQSDLLRYHERKWKTMLTKTKQCDSPNGLPTQCRLWTAGKTTNGYGAVNYRGKKRQRRAHRVSWMIAHNVDEVPKKNADGDVLEIRHLCNVPLCIEPTHLQLGTIAENANDKVINPNAKAKGEKHYNTSITEDIAKAIKLSKGNKSQRVRATEFNVSISIVRDIDAGTTWAHIPDKYGKTSEDKAAKMKANKKRLRDEAKSKPWTDKQWEQVREKLTNTEYVKVSDTKSFENTPCVEWIRRVEHNYGRMTMFGIPGLKVHILACTLGNGNVRPEGKEAAHKCGNSICVEPKHLYFATPLENAKDKIKHGTLKTKLSEAQVTEIRELKKKGMSQTALAKKFQVSEAQISRVVNKKMWTHV